MQDDAGAKTVRVCLDERSHGTASLAYDKLAGFQAWHLTPQCPAMASAPFVSDVSNKDIWNDSRDNTSASSVRLAFNYSHYCYHSRDD